MKKLLKISVSFFAASTISVSGFFAANASADQKSGEILNTRCTACHGLSKISRANHEKRKWEKTIIRMMNKKKFGKKLEQAQVEKLIDYILRAK